MTRESKNNNEGAVFTYHERRKMDHGTTHLRLPSAALKPWHHCALRLSPAESPVITPEGVLYDREAILLNLLQQKQEIRAQRIKHMAERNREERERAQKASALRSEHEARFAQRQGTVHLKNENRGANPTEQESLASNFWLPGSDDTGGNRKLHPAKRRKKDSLRSRTVCSVTGKPLKSCDLIALKPTQIEKESSSDQHGNDLESKSSKSNQHAPYICPVCQAALVNSAKPIALRSGTVICKRCADDFVRKDGRDPITGAELDLTSDVIEIQNSGTAFAASSSDNPASKEAKLYRPSAR